jgi:hypothetical protein
MAKDRLQSAIGNQVESTVHDVPEGHGESVSAGKRAKRTERLVLRMSVDEYKRLSRYFESKNLPLSTGARAALMELVRKA